MASHIWSASLNTTVGCIFRHLRNVANIDQAVVAEAVKLPASTISKLESGSANITIEYAFALCLFYEITLTEFARIVEMTLVELEKERVFIYLEMSKLEKSKGVDVNDHTVSVKQQVYGRRIIETRSFFGLLKGPDYVVYDDISEVESTNSGLSGAALTSASLAACGGGALATGGSIAIEEEEELELPKLSGKQIYSVLKDFLERIDMNNLGVVNELPNKHI